MLRRHPGLSYITIGTAMAATAATATARRGITRRRPWCRWLRPRPCRRRLPCRRRPLHHPRQRLRRRRSRRRGCRRMRQPKVPEPPEGQYDRRGLFLFACANINAWSFYLKAQRKRSKLQLNLLLNSNQMKKKQLSLVFMGNWGAAKQLL